MTNKEMGQIGQLEFYLSFEKEVENTSFKKTEVIGWILAKLVSRKELFDRWEKSRSLNDFYQISRYWEDELEFLDSLEYRRVEEASRYNLWQCYLPMVLQLKESAMKKVRRRIKDFLSEDEKNCRRLRKSYLFEIGGESND